MIDNKERNIWNPHNIMLQDRSGSLHKVVSTMKGFCSKTLAAQLNELQKNKITERKAFNEIPPGVEYRLITKVQELVESVYNLYQWLKNSRDC